MKRHNNELEIDEDISFERSTWKIQRVGWVIMLLIVLSAILGFTGRGGLLNVNKQTVTSTDGTMEIEYERFQRREASSELKITLKNISTPSPTIFFSTDFYTKQRIDKIIPEPEKVEAGADGIVYTFAVDAPNTQLIFHTKSTTFGQIQYSVQRPGSSAETIKHFVYP